MKDKRSDMQLLERRLKSDHVLQAHLAALVQQDAALGPVVEKAGHVALRAANPGFEGLSRIVIGQMLSVQSAAAIWERFCAVLGNVHAERFLALEKNALVDVGLSEAKYQTLSAIAAAELEKTLRYDLIETATVFEATEMMTAIKGIGSWTAQVYLCFCVGHPDIFPAGDLALRKAVGWHTGCNVVPDTGQTEHIARKWSPFRGAAARLMWRYYAVMKRKEGIGI